MKKFLFLLSLLVAAGASFADDLPEPYDGSTAYINVNTGWGTMSNLPTGSWAGSLNAGYNFNRGFALEGGYNILASSQYGATATSNIFDVAAKGTLPLSDVFSLYGRAQVLVMG